VKARALGLAALLLWAGVPAARADSAATQARQLLEWSGALALLEQTPRVAQLSLAAEAQRRNVDAARREAWNRALAPRFEPARLQRQLVDFLAARYQSDSFARAAELLQQPLPKRVRYFELAMARAGAAAGLREFLRQSAQSDPARLALVREVDSAAGDSLRMAQLQTLVARAVRRQIEGGDDPAPLAAEVAARQRHLQPHAEQYLLYTYRYLKDEELVDYRALLEDSHLQWLRQIVAQGLEEILEGAAAP
jgi:hypothetical protein